jgi:hypothetical protein
VPALAEGVEEEVEPGQPELVAVEEVVAARSQLVEGRELELELELVEGKPW